MIRKLMIFLIFMSPVVLLAKFGSEVRYWSNSAIYSVEQKVRTAVRVQF